MQDYSTIAELHRNFWTSKNAIELFLETEVAFETDFLSNDIFIFDLLKKELSNQSEEFNTLVEIGIGNGDVLNYLSSEFPKINRFIGIDLSIDQIEINKKRSIITKDLCL